MTLLGIDPGLNATGYGLIRCSREKIELIEAGTIEPNPRQELPIRLQKIYRHLRDIIAEGAPEAMVLEKLYAHYRHPTTASVLGHVRGVICLLCAECHINLVEHSVKRIRKAVTGSGGASKDQTQKMVAHLLGIDAGQLSQDASDALALALGYAGFIRQRS